MCAGKNAPKKCTKKSLEFRFSHRAIPTERERIKGVGRMRRYSPDDPLRVLDMQHMWQIRSAVIRALGYGYDYFLQRKNFVDWRRYLEYYPKKQVQCGYGHSGFAESSSRRGLRLPGPIRLSRYARASEDASGLSSVIRFHDRKRQKPACPITGVGSRRFSGTTIEREIR